MGRPKLGDVYEVRTRKGLAYVQHVLENDLVGEFVRVVPGFFAAPPDPDVVAGARSLLLVSYPVRAAVKQGLVRQVYTVPVPEEYRSFPVMRAGDGWLWDGRAEWREALGPEHRALPHRTTVAHGTLVGYVENELTNEDIDDLGQPRRPIDYPADGQDAPGRAHAEGGRHYLYFAQKKKAERARKVVEGFGYPTTLRPSADGDDWLLLVEIKGDVEEEQDLLERIAEGNDGEYDGSEVAVG